MESVLKRRMTATQQASELEIGDEAYEKLFQPKVPAKQPMIRNIPMDKLVSFFTADIGFHPYSPERLNAFAAQLAEEGLFERIIVRPIVNSDRYCRKRVPYPREQTERLITVKEKGKDAA